MCRLFSTIYFLSSTSLFVPNFLAHARLVVPGTDYCGAGNNPPSEDPYWAQTDACCQKHDSCEHKIPRFSSKFELRNNYPYTLNTCQCDAAFHGCLKKAGSWMSDTIGSVFFDTMNAPCFNLKTEKDCVDWTWSWYYWKCVKQGTKLVATWGDDKGW